MSSRMQMVRLTGETGKAIMGEIRNSAVTPYSVLQKKSKNIKTEILKKRANERKGIK